MMELARRSVDVPCTVDVAHTWESLHAHVELDDPTVGPGDEVLVHDAPANVGYGERIVCRRIATVRHAGWLARWWTRATSRFELTLLYEVSFSPGPAHRPARRRPR
ncbi:MAG: hypothetical protein U1F15_06015 [Burkholderiales bacterium]